MGLGDFLSDVGDAIVPESVENMAGGVVHGVQTAANVAGDVVQGAGWVANPTHWDDIGRGVGAVGSFIANNPGQAWDTAFEVGRHIVKEEILDPQNLAINLGMLAATTLTGGGAGAAWMAKIGMGARAGMGALRAGRIAEEGGSLIRAGRAASTAMRGAEDAWQAARATRGALSGIHGAEAAAEATSTAGKVMNKVTDVADFMPRQIARAREAVTGSPLGAVARGRASLASSFEGAAPGMLREAAGDVIRGSVMRPTAIGGGRSAERFAQGAYNVKRGETYRGRAEATETFEGAYQEVGEFQRNPEAYVTKKAGEAGVDIGALRAGYQTLRGAKKLKGEEDETEPKKPRAATRSAVFAGYAKPEGITSGAVKRGSQRSLGTSQSEYEESEFAVRQDRVGEFYHGMYEDQNVYDKTRERV